MTVLPATTIPSSLHSCGGRGVGVSACGTVVAVGAVVGIVVCVVGSAVGLEHAMARARASPDKANNTFFIMIPDGE
ncbi:MAG: hypothetical protein BZY87_01725 [SAR202 cluster bacterium Io17-Chloro-G6]|nr:MAG: hypothetical protein BZY87_01725 [SAR202 cluster bacterium Io17-Chloro-G6]